MHDDTWVPLHIREAAPEAREKYLALVESMSPALKADLIDYVLIHVRDRQNLTGRYLRPSAVWPIEQALRLQLAHGDGIDSFKQSLEQLDQLRFLSVVDFVVAHSDEGDWEQLEALHQAMLRSRFNYMVDREARQLRRVLPAGVEEVVRAALGVPAARAYMREAVHWATGLKPDPLKACDAMVRALEAVVLPAVAPNDAKATLGKILGQLRANTLSLSVGLPRSSQASEATFRPPEVVRGMLELVWSSYERHATRDAAPPTVEAAQSLLGVAGTLVDWFSTGIVKKG